MALSLRDIKTKYGFSRTTVWRKMKTDGFPKPFIVLGKTKRWKSDAIEAWLAEKNQAVKSP